VRLNFANASDVAGWVDEVLPVDAVIVLHIREASLFSRKFIRADWEDYVGNEFDHQWLYTPIPMDAGPVYRLVQSVPGERPDLAECEEENILGPFEAMVKTRNPMNSGMRIDYWLMKYDLNCINMSKE
jgi:hypothetical protein